MLKKIVVKEEIYMKKLKDQLKSISKSLTSLSKQVEKITNQVDKLQAKKTSSTPKKAAPKKAAPKKTAPKKTAPKKTAPKKTAPKKTAPDKKAPKKVPLKPSTVIDAILDAVHKAQEGITISQLKEKTEFNAKQLSNALYKLTKKGKIGTASRGVYVKK
jgi:uncharacterized protein YoxC